MKQFVQIVIAVQCTLLLSACSDEPAGPPHDAPVITTAGVRPNSDNVLSATIDVRALNVDSVVVTYKVVGTTNPGGTSTPAVSVVAGVATIPVLGLMPSSTYSIRVIAYGSAGETNSDTINFTTDALPSDLPSYTASGSDPSPGFVVFAAGIYGVVIDNTGRVVWYRRFPFGPGLSFMAEPNGRYVARPTPPNPTDADQWIEVDPSGQLTKTRGCADGLQSRPHDLFIDSDGGHWLLCDDVRTMNLPYPDGFIESTRITGTAVQHLDKSGKLLFSWTPFDHFDVNDYNPADRKAGTVNWTHGNGIDFDVDGNLLVSFRNLSEITKINVTTGEVMWRLGGRRNQFKFESSAAPMFRGQHGIRVTQKNEIVFLDNVGRPQESRAERYTLDPVTRTAVLSRDYGSSPAVVTQTGGSVQNLPRGRTLVSFGAAARVEEYDEDGRVVWRIDGNPGYVFRAQRILSLYKPGVGTAR